MMDPVYMMDPVDPNVDFRSGESAELGSGIVFRSLDPGLNEGVVRTISEYHQEPQWLLDRRLRAYALWKKMNAPSWAHLTIPVINYESFSYFSFPEEHSGLQASLVNLYENLGVPVSEESKKTVAMDAVLNSVSVLTTTSDALEKSGVIFCSISEAVRKYPDLVRQYLGSVVPDTDNFFSCLNGAVYSDGTFVYVPKHTHCPIDLSTYFRIESSNVGQFERTLIIADEGSSVSYLEGCTASRGTSQRLHAAVVELIAEQGATINYATVQNWYPGEDGQGGVLNFVTKRALCKGHGSRVSWVQVETGSSITWKYPSCILQGDESKGEFHSVALTRHQQQADTGSKMIHLGRKTSSHIISKGVSTHQSSQTYRGLVFVGRKAQEAQNYSCCDSLLVTEGCSGNTIPYLDVRNASAKIEHEASVSKIGEDQIFYLRQRGLTESEATSLIVHGFCKDVTSFLPLEFAVEAKKLLSSQLTSGR